MTNFSHYKKEEMVQPISTEEIVRWQAQDELFRQILTCMIERKYVPFGTNKEGVLTATVELLTES